MLRASMIKDGESVNAPAPSALAKLRLVFALLLALPLLGPIWGTFAESGSLPGTTASPMPTPPQAPGTQTPTAPAQPPPDVDTKRQIPNVAFGTGERLVFTVEFLGIKAGHATLEIPEMLEVGPAR